LDEPEARAAMVWIIGEYAERIDNADELLESFLEVLIPCLPAHDTKGHSQPISLFVMKLVCSHHHTGMGSLIKKSGS